MKISEVSVKVFCVGPPRQSVHTWCGILFQLKERGPQQVNADMGGERGKPFLLPLPCDLPYALQRL